MHQQVVEIFTLQFSRVERHISQLILSLERPFYTLILLLLLHLFAEIHLLEDARWLSINQ